MSKYLNQSWGPKTMTTIGINDNNQSSNSINYTSTMTHQYVPTSSIVHLIYVPTHQLLVSTMYLNHIPNTYTNITIKSYLTIHHSIHKPNTINPYIKPCATTSLLCILKLNQQLQQHITTKRPISICQIPTVSLKQSDICSNIEHPIPS
jgi:hypothetical protein